MFYECFTNVLQVYSQIVPLPMRSMSFEYVLIHIIKDGRQHFIHKVLTFLQKLFIEFVLDLKECKFNLCIMLL